MKLLQPDVTRIYDKYDLFCNCFGGFANQVTNIYKNGGFHRIFVGNFSGTLQRYIDRWMMDMIFGNHYKNRPLWRPPPIQRNRRTLPSSHGVSIMSHMRSPDQVSQASTAFERIRQECCPLQQSNIDLLIPKSNYGTLYIPRPSKYLEKRFATLNSWHFCSFL